MIERFNLARPRIVAGILLLGSLLYFALPLWAAQWAQQPFIGFVLDPNLVVNDTGRLPTWASRMVEPPIGYPERLTMVDGQSVSSVAELNALLETRAVGDELTLTFVQPQNSVIPAGDAPTSRTVTLPLSTFSNTDLLQLFWRYYLIGLITLGAGLWTFRTRPGIEAAQFFALFTLSAAWAVGGIFDALTTQKLIRLWITGLAAVGALHLLLVFVFPYETRFIRNRPRLRWVVFIPAGIIFIWGQLTLHQASDPWAYALSWRYAFILNGMSLIISFTFLAYRSLTAQAPLVRQQSRFMFVSAILTFAPVTAWFLSLLSFPLPFALIPLLIYPFAIGYLIIRYRLLDINIVLRRFLIYGILFIAYGGLVLLISLTVGPLIAADNNIILILFILLLTLTFDTLRTQLQGLIDQYFFRKPVQFNTLLQQYSQTLPSAVETVQVASTLLEFAQLGIPQSTIKLYLPDSETTTYTAYNNSQAPVLNESSPLIALMSQEARAIYLGDEHVWPTELRAHREHILDLNFNVVVPIMGGKRLLGWLAIQKLEEGLSLTPNSLNYLNALANQSSIALERVNVIRRLESRVTELNMLSHFSQALNFTIEFDDLLELVATNSQRLLDVHDFRITLLNPHTEHAYTAFALRDNERLLEEEGAQQAVDDPRIFQVLTTGQLLVSEEANDVWLGVPLNTGATTIGVLSTLLPHSRRAQERRYHLFSMFADRTAVALDRWMTIEKLHLRAQQLETINEVTGLLTATVDIDLLLELILQKAIELLDTAAGSLLLLDEDTGELVFQVVIGPGRDQLIGTRLPLGTGLAGNVAQTARPMLVNDVQHDTRWFSGIDDNSDFTTLSSLSVPLIRYRQVIGVIQVLNRKNGGPFTNDDQTLLTAFAGQSTVALETARLVQQTDKALQSRVTELSLLTQLDRDLSTTLALEPIVNLTLDRVLRVCDAIAGAIVLLDGDDLQIYAVRGYDPSFDYRTVSTETIRAGLVGQAIMNGETLTINDVQNEPTYIAAAFATRSQMTVPIIYKQDIIGAVAIESDKINAFDRIMRDTAIRVIAHAGAAIANALLYEQVIDANNAKSEFVSMVSHELKTPMTAIQGYVDLILAGMTGEVNFQQEQFLDTISNNVTKMGRLIQDLTDISRMEMGRLYVSAEKMPFAPVVSEALQTTQPAYTEKGTQLHVDLPAELPLVMGDQERLVQVMTNLLSNACKYSPPASDVFVKVEPDIIVNGNGQKESVVVCSVQDTGYGISDEDKEQLFTKFFRSGDPDIRQSPGTGLGLSITKGIVELHGGTMWYESKLGEGTMFSFTLPQAAK